VIQVHLPVATDEWFAIVVRHVVPLSVRRVPAGHRVREIRATLRHP
jgi:hypothetical protein